MIRQPITKLIAIAVVLALLMPMYHVNRDIHTALDSLRTRDGCRRGNESATCLDAGLRIDLGVHAPAIFSRT